MKVRLEYLKDIVGNNYLAINMYHDTIYPYLNQLKGILDDNYDSYTKNQQNRDRGHYHITVINVIEYNKLLKETGADKFINSLEKYFHEEFNITLMGIGKAEREPNTAYFIVVKSEELQEFRKIFGLPEYDFHITLGFLHKDVFGVRKNTVLKLQDPFLKLLKNEYYKNNESFNFVKKLQNFDGDVNDEVEVVKIENEYATFRIGKDKYYSVSLIGNDLMVSAKWNDSKNLPIIPNTIIYRKMNNK